MNGTGDFKPIQTKASLALALQGKPEAMSFQALVFQEPKPGATIGAHENHDRKYEKLKRNQDGAENQEFDIKKARHEVIRFATQNQRVVKNKKKMQIRQAIELGAKPPKKAYKNYKELLDERKRLKQIREERQKFHQLGKNQAGAASIKCRSKTKLEKSKKKRAPVTDIDQHYGVVKPKLKRK